MYIDYDNITIHVTDIQVVIDRRRSADAVSLTKARKAALKERTLSIERQKSLQGGGSEGKATINQLIRIT